MPPTLIEWISTQALQAPYWAIMAATILWFIFIYTLIAGGAYWLIDEIALALGSRTMQKRIALDPRAGDMQFWSLRVRDDQSADLVCEVDQDQPILTKRIAFTDFPLDRADIWAGFDGRRWTLYLPSEH